MLVSAKAKEEKSPSHNLPGVPALVVICDWKGGSLHAHKTIDCCSGVTVAAVAVV